MLGDGLSNKFISHFFIFFQSNFYFFKLVFYSLKKNKVVHYYIIGHTLLLQFQHGIQLLKR